MENQITNLELSKKLKELNVKQKSYFYWWEDNMKDKYTKKPSIVKNKPHKLQKSIKIYSAFTVAELGKILISKEQGLETFIDEHKTITVRNDINEDVRGSAKTEANARAKMLIYLLKNNLIKLK